MFPGTLLTNSYSMALYFIYSGAPSMLYLILGRTRGQGMLEYALIIALVAVVVITSLMLLGPQVSTIFHKVSNNL
jgi:pilus assembly protein Flp/PilA